MQAEQLAVSATALLGRRRRGSLGQVCGRKILNVSDERLPRPQKILFIDNFRAVAIFLIVSGHTYWLAFSEAPAAASPIGVIMSLITGGTAYFVFISGFLYRHVFYHRVNYTRFMQNKFRNVVMPYLVLGIPLAIYVSRKGIWSVVVSFGGEPLPHSLFIDLVFLLVTGGMAQGYWFIPFILMIFLLSPIFDIFLQFRRTIRYALFVALALLAMLVHRAPIADVDQFQNLFYYMPFYVLGMLCASEGPAFIRFIGRPSVLSISFAFMLFLAYLQAYFLGEVGNVRDTPFTPRLDLMFVQKLSGIVFFCSLLHLFGKFAESPLALVANMSFSIYFLHPIIALAIGAASRGEPVRTGNLYIDLALYSVLVFGLSLAAGSFVKRGLRERSRLVIGS